MTRASNHAASSGALGVAHGAQDSAPNSGTVPQCARLHCLARLRSGQRGPRSRPSAARQVKAGRVLRWGRLTPVSSPSREYLCRWPLSSVFSSVTRLLLESMDATHPASSYSVQPARLSLTFRPQTQDRAHRAGLAHHALSRSEKGTPAGLQLSGTAPTSQVPSPEFSSPCWGRGWGEGGRKGPEGNRSAESSPSGRGGPGPCSGALGGTEASRSGLQGQAGASVL